MRTKLRVYLTLLAVLILPLTAFAQSSAGIAGTARDATGAVLPGVTVEASSSGLIEKVRNVVTDDRGEYKIVDLPPAIYTVTFSLTGFNGMRRENIELTAGFTATVNAEMRVGSLEETITVTGSSPVVDVHNVVQQQVMTRDVIDAIPTAKVFQNLGALVPGMTLAGSSNINVQDVGGQSGMVFVRMAIHGGGPGDQQLFEDGYATQILSTDGAAIVFFPVDGNIQEYQMETSAHSAEAETGGVRVNMVHKTGGNEFNGTMFANFANKSFQSNNYSEDLRRRGLASPNSAKAVWTVSPAFGGPITKNKVWFFVAGHQVVADNYVAGRYENTNIQGWSYEPDLTRQMVNDQHDSAGNGRITWQANRRDRFTGLYEYNYLCNCHFASSPVAPEAAFYATFKNHIMQGTWTAPFTNKVLVQLGASNYLVRPYHLAVQPDSSNHSIVDNAGPNAGIRYSAVGSDNFLNSQVANIRTSLSYVTGSHAAKVGLDLRMSSLSHAVTFVPGNATYTLLNGRASSVTYSSGPIERYMHIRPNMGFYVQDQWTVSRLTLNGGVRFDWFRTDYPDETLAAAQYRPTVYKFPGATVLNWKDLNPRLGLAYDAFGSGKTAFKWTLGRYVGQQATALTDRVNPVNAISNSQTRTWTDANGDFVVQGDPLIPEINGELGLTNNRTFGQPVVTTTLDPRFATGFGVRSFNWELSAGVQHELVSRVSVNAMYYRRWYGNFQVTLNRAVTPADYSSYCVNAPGDPRLPDGGGQQICGLFDINPAKQSAQDNLVSGSQFFGKQLAQWNGFDLTANVRPRNGLLLQGGASIGKELSDNCEIAAQIGSSYVSAVSVGTTNLGVVGNPSTRFCRVETPFLTNAKFLASYTFPRDLLQVSAAFQGLPPPNITATYTATNAQIAPNLGRNLAAGPGGTASVGLVPPGTLYGERMSQFDLRFAKSVNITGMRIQGTVDIYNILNGNAVLSLNNNYGTNGASWQVPLSTLAPRLVKFGVQLTF